MSALEGQRVPVPRSRVKLTGTVARSQWIAEPMLYQNISISIDRAEALLSTVRTHKYLGPCIRDLMIFVRNASDASPPEVEHARALVGLCSNVRGLMAYWSTSAAILDAIPAPEKLA
jgi:hypothetical protein